MSSWHIVTSEYPPDVGGVSDYTRQVAEGLARMGDEVHVWCPHGDDERGVKNLQVHSELGAIGPRDLKRLGECLNGYPAPRRLLVQWVPHGFGYRSMNLWFCAWLAGRAWRGDEVQLMVHEPYLEFRLGPLRHVAVAAVHRLMTVVLLAAARRVWMSIPAWEPYLRPYTLGRKVPMQWLPVPGCVADERAGPVAAIRLKFGRHVIGHFGTYGPLVAALLGERLTPVMDSGSQPSLLLLGSGSERFRDELIERRPTWRTRVHASGYLSPEDLGAHITACDLFVQPYPDGITSRRTSAMACLSRAVPVVTTTGHLTEPLWAQTGAVALVDVNDTAGFVSAVTALLDRADARRALGQRGRRIYAERFSMTRVVDALRAA